MSGTDAASGFPLPASVVFEVTRRCNHDCPHCYNAWKNHRGYPDGRLSPAATLRLLERLLDETPIRHVTLTGGEPLLRPDLPEIVEMLAARGVGLNLITNGTLLTDALLDRLGGRISVYELPLLSANAAVHDRLSGAPGAYDRVTETIAELTLRGHPVVAVFVATRHNLRDLRETIELAVTLGVSAVMLNRFNPGGTGARHIDELQLAPAELQEAMDLAEDLSGRYDLPISCSIAMPPCLLDTARYERLTFGFCAVGTERAYYAIDPRGRLRPCNHSPTILGDLTTSSFRELLDGETLRRFVAAHPRLCAGCALEHDCLGGCKAAAEACYGSPELPDPFLKAFEAQIRRPEG